MAVPGSHSAIFRCDGAVGIFNGIHALINPRLDAVVGRHPAVPKANVYHIERFGSQVLSQLQVLVIAQSIGGAVTPVHVPMAFTLLYRSDGALPAEGVIRALLALHEAASWETHELWMHLPQHVGQVRPHAVLAVLEGGREEAHHIKLHLPHAVEDKGKLRLRVVAVGSKRCLILRPSLGLACGEIADHSLSIKLRAVLRAECCLHGALIFQSLGPRRQPVAAALHGIDAPITLVHQADGH